MNVLTLTDRELRFLDYVIGQTSSFKYPDECESLRQKVQEIAEGRPALCAARTEESRENA